MKIQILFIKDSFIELKKDKVLKVAALALLVTHIMMTFWRGLKIVLHMTVNKIVTLMPFFLLVSTFLIEFNIFT